MLEANQVEIPDMIFQGWEEPEAINVFYYSDPETGNKVSSGFSVTYPKSKEELLTTDFKEKLEKMNLEKVVVVDHNEGIGDLETTYTGLTSSGVEVEDSITFSFSSESSLTYIKPIF
jgi:hypothetical protein